LYSRVFFTTHHIFDSLVFFDVSRPTMGAGAAGSRLPLQKHASHHDQYRKETRIRLYQYSPISPHLHKNRHTVSRTLGTAVEASMPENLCLLAAVAEIHHSLAATPSLAEREREIHHPGGTSSGRGSSSWPKCHPWQRGRLACRRGQTGRRPMRGPRC